MCFLAAVVRGILLALLLTTCASHYGATSHLAIDKACRGSLPFPICAGEQPIENPNNVLLDDGDNIQGTILGDLQAVATPIPCSATLAIHKAMNALKYDGDGMGNHEFNYGLPFLSQVTNTECGIPGVSKSAGACGAPAYPLVLSNVTAVATQKPIFAPYALLARDFDATGPDGSKLKVKLNIGIMSFVPPQILDWDQKNVAGKVAVGGAPVRAGTAQRGR